VEFAGHADRHRLQARIEQVGAAVGDRPADRDRARARFDRDDVVGQGKGSGFGRAVAVDDALRPLRRGQRLRDLARVERVAADQQMLQASERRRERLLVFVEQADRQPQRGRAAVEQRAVERRRIEHGVGRDHQHPRAVEQRAPDFPGAGVERRIGAMGDAVLFAQDREGVVDRQPQDVAVFDHHALGFAGRTRGV
ncbi:hypothetical protein CATMIT_01924, partial [Catenibacterium mitsuokai DSM 15897]